MLRKAEEIKSSRILFFCCALAYIAIFLTKTAFAASVVGIVSDGFFTKTQSGIINGSYFMFYGGGQLFGGKIADRISPYKLITVAVSGAVLSLFGMAVSSGFYPMLIIWSLGGLLQFGVWPSVIRIISQYILPEHKKKATAYIGFCSCIGTIFSYFCASSVLNNHSWRILFLVYCVILASVLLIWVFVPRKSLKILISIKAADTIPADTVCNNEKASGFGRLLITSGLIILILPTFIRQTLSALNTWVPTMIKELYGVTPAFASSLNMILSAVNLGGVLLVIYLYPRKIKSIVVLYFLCFVSVIPFTLLLLLSGKIPVWFIVLLLCGLTTVIYSASQCINVIIPTYFAKYNRAGSVAAILNAAGSFGSVAASSGFGIMADRIGWSGTIISWSILAVTAAVLSSVAIPIWERFTKEHP